MASSPVADVRPHRRPMLGAMDLVVAAVLLICIWAFLPARWWPVDIFGTLVAFAFAVTGVGFLRGEPWARRAGIVVGAVTTVAGAILVTAVAFTASYLSGLYGPVGQGGALILLAAAILLVPYLVVFPASQLFALTRPDSPSVGLDQSAVPVAAKTGSMAAKPTEKGKAAAPRRRDKRPTLRSRPPPRPAEGVAIASSSESEPEPERESGAPADNVSDDDDSPAPR